MEKITDVDSKKINLKPKSYSENKGIWSLMHFNDLRNDFVNSLDFLMREETSSMQYEYDLHQVSLNNCQAYTELTYLISQLSLIALKKEKYSDNCNYEQFANDYYIKRKKLYLSASTVNRNRKVISEYIQDELNEHSEEYVHLVNYMKNV